VVRQNNINDRAMSKEQRTDEEEVEEVEQLAVQVADHGDGRSEVQQVGLLLEHGRGLAEDGAQGAGRHQAPFHESSDLLADVRRLHMRLVAASPVIVELHFKKKSKKYRTMILYIRTDN
jgi:hypothetical protein